MEAPARQTASRRLLPQLVISLGIGAAIALMLSRNGLPLVPPRESFGRLDWRFLGLGALLVVAMHLLRAARWRHLVAPVRVLPLVEVLELNFVGFLAIFAVPFRLGEAVRPALTKLRHGIPVSVGLGTIAVERVVDGLVTSLCVAVALFVVPMRPTSDPIARALPAYASLALTIFVGAFAALALFMASRSFAVKLVSAVVGVVSTRLSDFLSSKVASVADGMRVLSSPALAAAFMLETAVYWFVNALSMWALARGCGLSLSVGHAVAIMGVLAIGILLPAGPGMFGSFQLALFAGLRCYVPESEVAVEGAAYVFVLYVLQAVVVSATGFYALSRMHLRVADVLGAGRAEP